MSSLFYILVVGNASWMALCLALTDGKAWRGALLGIVFGIHCGLLGFLESSDYANSEIFFFIGFFGLFGVSIDAGLKKYRLTSFAGFSVLACEVLYTLYGFD